VRPRQIAPVALVLALTLAGFYGARLLGERDARRDSEHRAEVAAAQIRGRVEEGASLAESLRRFMVSVAGSGVTSGDFAGNASRWLSPAGFPAAAWVEQVPASRRATYERRIRLPIVTADRRGAISPVGSRSSYLPATLVSGIPPMAVPGIDLGGEPGVAAALARASTLDDAAATPLATLRDGLEGLFLIRLAPRLTGGVEPGFAVVFVPEPWLRAAATDTATLQLTTGRASSGDEGAAAVHSGFTEAGQRFDVAVPQRSLHGPAAVLPWIILAAGLVLAALAAALGVNAARRASAQDELDRIFTLSPDLIAVADFDGHFTRVNPAVEQILGYTQEEFLARRYPDLVHPDDRERTAAEAAAISQGKPTVSFENRYVRKDGSDRVLEWTSTPVVEDGLMYGVARDVTERREAEAELERLAGEQAALRRVATLVARGVPAAELFSAVAEELERLFDAEATTIGRLEPDRTMTIVASRGRARDQMAVGTRLTLASGMALAMVVRTGRAARVDDYSHASGFLGQVTQRTGIRCSVAVPIMVEGSLWGSMGAGTEREQFPADAERRMAEFTELAATAIANAESRSELTASRARLVAASDETRRQIERNLHDGTQQRLVSLGLALRAAEANVPPELDELRVELSRTVNGLTEAVEELQEISRGIHPAIVAEGGLGPALRALARRSAVPVDLDVRADERRLPERVEVAAYYVVSEALTNAAKHAHASTVRVHIDSGASILRLAIHDDGVGGTDPARGSGLVGLSDRVEALGGRLKIASAVGLGTALHVTIPIDGG
jgi:PAS domain S-box-containing protein